MIACIIFVFGALLEYTVILLKLKLKKVRAGSKHQNGTFISSKGGECADLMPKNGKPIHRKKSTTQGRNITSRWSSSTKYFLGANKADRFSRTDLIFLCVFPIMFLLFNIAYWTAIYCWRWGEGREAFNDE